MMEQNTFVQEIEKILSLAEKQAVTLRLLGANAIRIHSQTARNMASSRPLTDLDFIGYKKDRCKIEAILGHLGYQSNPTFNLVHGDERLLFFGYEGQLKVDVWLEVFRMAHTFNFRDRLPLDSPTLPLADLLMTKLQIVDLNEKDVKDVIYLLTDHDFSENDEDREKINIALLARQCAKDWGMYRTFTINLRKIKDLAPNYVDSRNATQAIGQKIDNIISSIDAAPKSLAWNLRAKVGERKSWYETPDVR